MGFLDHLPTLAEARTARCAAQKGESRLERKVRETKDETKLERAWHKAIDKRDGGKCRWCHRKTLVTIELVPERREHHHVSGRIVQAIKWDVRNGLTLCKTCHERVTGRVNERFLIESRHTFTVEHIAYINADKPVTFRRIA